MRKTATETKEPLIHITKRTKFSLQRGLLVRGLAVVAALVVSGLVALLLIDRLGDNPSRLGEFYACFIKGNFSTSELTWKFFKNTAVLLCISLAVTPAFRMRFWNIGAEGQTLMGVLGAIMIAHDYAGTMPEWLLLVVMFVTALVFGAVWALIPAIFKTIWNTNETLFTLMMNYVAQFVVGYFLLKWVPSGNALGIVEGGWLPVVWHNYFLIILTAFVLMGILFVYLNYTKHGYEISVVGESENTARYIGINVKKVVLRTMILSGLLCGLAGFLIGAGLDHSINVESSVGGLGFTAIMVSWLANFNPLVMAGTSGLIVFLQTGAEQISETFDVQGMMPNIVVGIILLFIIGSEFFLHYHVYFRGQEVRKKGEK